MVFLKTSVIKVKSAENGYTMTLRSWNRVSRESRIAILWQIIVGFHNVTA